MILDYLNQNTIRLKVRAETKDEVIEKAAEPLIESGKIQPQYVKEMKDALRQFGPYMVMIPGVAVLHAKPGASVNEECMSLMTLEEAVVFGNKKNDPVSTALVIGSPSEEKHCEVLAEVSKLFLKEEFLELLKSGSDVKELIQFLGKEAR